jgi:hypothetical protein
MVSGAMCDVDVQGNCACAHRKPDGRDAVAHFGAFVPVLWCETGTPCSFSRLTSARRGIVSIVSIVAIVGIATYARVGELQVVGTGAAICAVAPGLVCRPRRVEPGRVDELVVHSGGVSVCFG